MEQIYRSILTIAPNAKFDKTTNKIDFHTASLPLKLEEDNIINIIGCLSIQIDNLTKNNYGIIDIDFDDLIQIRNKVFFINPNKIYKLDEKKYMTLMRPIKQQRFAPEIPKELPAKVYYTSSYYSLGKLVEALTAGYVPENSKLFHFIRRTKKDEKERQLLFI
jgi:hypothetical protein